MLQLLVNQILDMLLLFWNDKKLFWIHAIYTLTTDNKHEHWVPILTAVSVLNTYSVHDLNGLDTYNSCTVHE